MTLQITTCYLIDGMPVTSFRAYQFAVECAASHGLEPEDVNAHWKDAIQYSGTSYEPEASRQALADMTDGRLQIIPLPYGENHPAPRGWTQV